MANSYSWSVKCLYTKDITESGSTYADVIKKATVYLKATDSGGDSAETGIDMDFNNPADWSKFTAYGSVTEANVIAWTEARLGNDTLTDIKFRLDREILENENVKDVTAKGTGSGEFGDESFTPTFPWS
jgi:hypothetical protein|tara:strand:- start:1041 stop:1427 length:387 start_codon:yes stop_codon:yes gene_type:complete